MFRAGRLYYCGGSIKEVGEAQPLPERFVVVGATGEGHVIVDTANDTPVLLWLDNEGYWRNPLIDFVALSKTPDEVAKVIIGDPAAE